MAVGGALKWPEFEGLGLTSEQQLAYNRFRFWRIVMASSIWYSFYYLGRLNWGLCIPWIIKDTGFTKFQCGLVDTGLLWAYAIGTFLSGRLGDRYGPRIMQTIGGYGSIILNILTALQSYFTGIFIVYTVNGFVQGQAYAPTNMLITQWYPKARRGFATGIYGTSMGVASLVVWIITGYVVAHYGWRAAFIWPLLIFTLPTTVILWFLVRNKPEDAGFPAYRERMEESISAKAEKLTDEEIKGVRAWLLLFKNWRFICICIASLFGYIGRYGLLTWITLFYAETAGIKLKAVPIMTFALPFGMMFGPVTAGWLSDKFFKAKRFQMTCFYFIGAIIVLFLMAFIPIKVMGLPIAIILLILAGMLTLGVVGVIFTVGCDFGGRKMAGTAVGTLNFFNYFGAGVQGVLIGGLLTATGGNWTIVFSTIGGLMVIGTFLMFITKE